ncbi:DUF1972 domain-containing protein [Thermococcus radiotolerans]|uniref:Glycosyl transferase family 1 n=1 Tax=Thermococcus radiotolerans TaxID=187880 RepID=A0A2Z2N0M9_9EURY|nr:DUF1972 domain-containing protein [Thermococcus radiotolerans]ASJ15371.1 hypothetical protein A3L10_09605 [Thermococcus radiotolerans]
MQKPKIAIVGLRGIPSKYGGTETFVEELTTRLKDRFQFYVMHEDTKFFEDEYDGIIRVHSPAVESKSTSIPSINDFLNAAYTLSKHREEIELLYFLGPDSSVAAILAKLAKKKILINPDGVEWRRLIKRSQFVPFHIFPVYLATMVYMYLMEYLSCKLPDIVVADSIGIKKHLEKRHNPRMVVYIAYGARELLPSTLSTDEERNILEKFDVEPNGYYLTVARIVAENNIHMEIEGFRKAKSAKKLVIVGNFNRKDPYTRYLFKLKGDREDILLLDPIYDREVLGVLRKNCFAYIHAYEVGGTNPSLLEQMLFKRPILAYDVPFNKEVLQEGGVYFKDVEDLADKMEMLEKGELDLRNIRKTQVTRIRRQYNWEKVVGEYERVFRVLIGRG